MVVVSSTVSDVIKQTPSTKLLVNDEEVGTATLYVTKHNVVWSGGVRPDGGAAPSLALLYNTISMHGVQHDPASALFMVLDFELRLGDQPTVAVADDDDEFDPDDQPITRLHFIPADEGELPSLYEAMNQGQALHPDPADCPSDEDEDQDQYMDGEEFEDEEQFEDAEEVEATPEEAAERLRQLQLQAPNGHHQNGANGDNEIDDE